VSTPIAHERALKLLPWLANGSLAAHERDALEEHVRHCLACRRELKDQQRLRAAVLAQPTVHISPESGFDKLLPRLDEPTTPARGRARSRWTPAFASFAFVGAAAAVLVAALVWLAIPPGTKPAPGDYHTLASPGDAALDLDVVFVDSITAAQMQAVLGEIGGEITAGPSKIGRYRVRLKGRTLTREELDDLATRLEADPRVRLAAPALGAGAPP
jgi:anti-sigma factor RsiW